MALVLNNVPKYKTLTGVFHGQTQPIKIGTQATVQGPNYIGLYKGDDSVTMNAFFDPVLSPAVTAATQKYGPIPNIGYIQTGQFLINNTPLPLSIHQTGALYPNTQPMYSGFERPYTWIDICEKNSDDGLVTVPYYAFWQLKDKADYPLDNFIKHPQEFGGITKFPLAFQTTDNDYLCAYMTSEADLGSGDIAKPSINKALDETPADQFMYIPTNIPWHEIPGFDLRTTINRLNGQIKPFNTVIPPLSTVSEKEPIWLQSADKSRIYIQYVSEVKIRKENVQSLQIIMLLNNPETPGTAICAQISDFVTNLQDSMSATDIDLVELDKKIRELTNAETVVAGFRWKNQLDLGLAGKPMTMSYRYTVYPCNIKTTVVQNVLQQVDILRFEGFSWEVARKYDPATGWEDNSKGTISPCRFGDTWNFMMEIERYYQKITNSKDVKVIFPFFGFF